MSTTLGIVLGTAHTTRTQSIWMVSICKEPGHTSHQVVASSAPPIGTCSPSRAIDRQSRSRTWEIRPPMHREPSCARHGSATNTPSWATNGLAGGQGPMAKIHTYPQIHHMYYAYSVSLCRYHGAMCGMRQTLSASTRSFTHTRP